MASATVLSDRRITVGGQLPDAERQRLWLMIRMAIWLIPPLAFTVPSAKAIDGFDPSDVAKLLILASLALAAIYVVATRWYRGASWMRFWPIAGLITYSSFGLVSAVWSPLRIVSIDKAGSLGLLCLYAIAIGCVASDRPSIERVWRNLAASLIAFSGFIFLFYLYDPTLTGLDRLRINTGGNGLIHPTASGSTASLGILMMLAAKYHFKFQWSWRWWLATAMTHVPILLLSNSRMSILMLAVAGGPMLLRYIRPAHKALVLGAVASVALTVIAIDPGLIGIGSSLGSVGEYITRGQSSGQLREASGRVEMWEAIWNEYVKSPLRGHGYFVTSEAGEVEVWFVKANHLSHNLVLQVLVTTGIIGLAIFSTGIASLAVARYRLWQGNAICRTTAKVTGVFAIWYFGWSLLATSFLGPVRPESLVFFTLCGLILGLSGSSHHR